MKKTIKKGISKIFPKGDFKERVKLFYYNLNKPKHTFFELIKINGNTSINKTTFKELSLNTNEALYFVVPDFDYYQHFYKVKTDDVVIDAGSNCGHLALLFSKLVGKNGLVYAFEPDKFNIDRINANISLNQDLPENIKIQELLLWDENKFVDFYEAGTVGSSAVWIPNIEECVKKEAIRIDDWMLKNKVEKLDFIKMDIEGAEIEALEGCIETIKKHSPNFAIASYHIVNGEKTHIKLEQFFKKLNYPYKTVKFRGDEIITFAGPCLK